MGQTENFSVRAYDWNRQDNLSCLLSPDDETSCARGWWTDQIRRNQALHITDVGSLPQGAEELQALLAHCGVQSFLSVPIESDGHVLGFLGIDSRQQQHQWDEDHSKLLQIIANLLATGLIKIGADREIEQMAYYDHLTLLPNRLLFTDRTNQAISLAKRTGKLIGILFVDLDSFKAVNDTLGHRSGDILLQEVAVSLRTHLRSSDTVARFGGDEFLVMINNMTSTEDILRVVNSILCLFQKPFQLEDGKEFYITISAGLSVFPTDGEDVEALIKNADVAMYRAKSLGKNQCVLCTPALKEEVHQSIRLSNDLFRAQDRGELEVYYQPQVDLSQNKITGLEALLRWNHPQLGMILPDRFIELAEKNGLINGIGDWVFRQACAQNKRWQNMGFSKLRMAVNVSVHQFKNPGFVNSIENVLAETGLEPRYLEIEITESTATKESASITTALQQLKDFGICISIDDFGTEYSSLSRLKTLPIDRVKIDMQFIQGLEDNEKDQEITKIIIYLAKSLGLKVLAEGVETTGQLDFLNHKMCDEVQGFYYYKPMPAQEVEIILKQHLE